MLHMETEQTYMNARRDIAVGESTFIKAHRKKLLSGLPADYWELTKPEISFLVLLATLAGFLLGSEAMGHLDGWLLLHTLIGTAFTAAGSGVLNHAMEYRWDALMRRTANRPLPAGRIAVRQAYILGILLSILGVGYLYAMVNVLTALLAGSTILLYIFLYTPTKRVTTLNTLIGCIPGALPALGGWAAATGSLDPGGWALYAILFFWQMPHFLSLAWMYRKDYARAGFAMLPVVDETGTRTARQMVLYTILLVLTSLLPYFMGLTGTLYLTGALLLGIYFLVPVFRFYRHRTNQQARKILLASIVYIPALLAIIFVDLLL